MAWLVDGSNLGGLLDGAAGAHDPARVVRFLLPWTKRGRLVVLVFDGEPDARVADRYGSLRVVWSGAGRSADDRLVSLVARDPRGGTVVTGDTELARRCRERGARVESAAWLVEQVDALRSANERGATAADKPQSTRGEVERWLALFSEDGGAPGGTGRRPPRGGAKSAFLALGLGLALGCGDSAYLPTTGRVTASSMAARPEIDACLLMLRSDVDPHGELGLTKASNLLDDSENPFFAKCSYGKRRPWTFVSLDVRRALTVESARSIQKASRPFLRRLAREPLVEVPGVGENAVWAGGQLGQLHVHEGDLRFILTIEVGADEDRLELAKRLARLALERLHVLGWHELPAAAATKAAT
jgi:hypothetical protein